MKKFSIKNLSITNLIKKDRKIVEKRKWMFLASVSFVVVSLIAMGIYWSVLGSPLNLGMDFTGGYTIQIEAGTKINENNYTQYSDEINDLIENYVYTDSSNVEYKINLNSIVRIGSQNSTSLRIEFRAPTNIKNNDKLDSLMENELIPDLVEKLNELVAYITPAVSVEGSTATVVYDTPIKSFYQTDLSKYLANGNISVSSTALNEDNKTITLNLNGEYSEAELVEALRIKDRYSARARYTDMVGGSVSADLITGAISAIIIALIIMLIYIFFRFEFVSGISAIIALVHDAVIVFMFMILFRVEFNATFIAALITVLAYSINNSIIIFDRIRENITLMNTRSKNVSVNQIANRSVLDSFSRTINATLTTLIMISMIAITCAIGGIGDMVTFTLPIIVGLLTGFFSANCIAPSIWSMMYKNNPNAIKLKKAKEEKPKAEPVATTNN